MRSFFSGKVRAALYSMGRALPLAIFGLLFIIATANLNASAQLLSPGAVDPTFTGGVMTDGSLPDVILIQPDGKHLIGGRNTAVNGRGRNLVARVHPDGSLDESFLTDSRYEGQVMAMALQPDGKIIIGGVISIRTNPDGTNIKRNIARLNADGTLDAAFSTGGGTTSGVTTISLQPDGKILIGGRFDTIDGVGRRGVARLNIDGSVDTTFNPGTGLNIGTSYVNAIALQPNGQVLIGGRFSEFNGTASNNIARLNSNGTLDTTFNVGTGTDQEVYTVALQSDGKVIIGGIFNTYKNAVAQYIARLNIDGTHDTSFIEGSGGNSCPIAPPCERRRINGAQQITVLNDGKFYVSSRGFQVLTNPSRPLVNIIVRFNADGSLDTSFNQPQTSDQISILYIEPSRHAVQADGKVVTNVPRLLTVPGEAVHTFSTRYNSNGSFDSTYAPVLKNVGFVDDVIIQPDGKVIVIGSFSNANTDYRRSIVRFNVNGTVDTAFNANIPGTPTQVALQSDGKIIVVGNFSQVNGGVQRGRIVRFNADGTVDNSFNSQVGADSTINALSLQPDGKVIIGGIFNNYNGTSRKGIARLNTDGSLDTSFNPGTGFTGSDKIVEAITVQPDGKIVVGGTFDTYNGTQRRSITRLNIDGSLDTTFNPGTGTSLVKAVKVLPNGKILIAGGLTTYNDVLRKGIVRINADGSLDTTFSDAAQPNGSISEIYVQANGKIILGGNFISIAGQTRRGVARLSANGLLDNTFGANMEGALPNAGIIGYVGMAVDEANSRMYFGSNFSTFNNIGRGSLVRLFTGNTLTNRTMFDYDGDGRADLSVFRPLSGSWYISNSSNNAFTATQFGANGDLIAPADFDGDGKTDINVFRPSDGGWYRLNSSNNTFTPAQFGTNGDLPVPGDFDGDGRADLTVFRPSTGSWFRINSSNNQFVAAQFGSNGDKPLVGDFDGDGKSDLTVFRPSNGTWYRINSATDTFSPAQFGATGDLPVAADYDGDGKTDLAVYRPSVGDWYIINSSNGSFTGLRFGISEDKPAPADFDGDGKADLVVWRPSNGTWYLLRTTAGFTGFQFGANGDIPTPNAFVR